jgi:hypothetical protein
VEQLRRRRYSQKYYRTLKEGVKKRKKKGGNLGLGGGYSNTRKRDIQDIASGNRTIN